jgi:rhodanese-related sulfurtransferase
MSEQTKFFEAKLAFEIDVFDLFTALNDGERIVIVDTRQRHAFENECIPGAVSLPYREISQATTKDFHRDVLYVTYCSDIGCNASTKGALNLSKLGFRVKELIGGIEYWKLDGYATEGASAKSGLKAECAC